MRVHEGLYDNRRPSQKKHGEPQVPRLAALARDDKNGAPIKSGLGPPVAAATSLALLRDDKGAKG
jgi:hypothetical protein